MTTYTWAIAQLDTAPSVGELADVVTCIHWRLRGDEGEHSAEIYGAAELPEPSPEDFSDFDTLTKAEVLGWLAGVMDMDEAEARVAQRLADMQAPAIVPRDVPWA